MDEMWDRVMMCDNLSTKTDWLSAMGTYQHIESGQWPVDGRLGLVATKRIPA
jgi:hypothetical protein